MSALEIELFPCREDNYGVLLHDPQTRMTASIDVPNASEVDAILVAKGWSLTHILVTHHHIDHVEGIEELKEKYGAVVVGPSYEADQIPGIDRGVSEGDTLTFSGRTVDIYHTPGHTMGHICFSIPGEKLLFAADTVFPLGCGRLFEGDAADMWSGYLKLIELPDDTVIYSGHEYTLGNAEFALTVDGDNQILVERVEQIRKMREAGMPTVPTTMELEKQTNPFFRVQDAGVRKNLGMETASDVEVFAEIRTRKDNF